MIRSAYQPGATACCSARTRPSEPSCARIDPFRWSTRRTPTGGPGVNDPGPVEDTGKSDPKLRQENTEELRARLRGDPRGIVAEEPAGPRDVPVEFGGPSSRPSRATAATSSTTPRPSASEAATSVTSRDDEEAPESRRVRGVPARPAVPEPSSSAAWRGGAPQVRRESRVVRPCRCPSRSSCRRDCVSDRRRPARRPGERRLALERVLPGPARGERPVTASSGDGRCEAAAPGCRPWTPQEPRAGIRRTRPRGARLRGNDRSSMAWGATPAAAHREIEGRRDRRNGPQTARSLFKHPRPSLT